MSSHVKSPAQIPTRRDVTNLSDERWQGHAPSAIRFRTLFLAPDTPTDSIVCGITMMAAGDTFALHAHDHAEVYFGLEGEGDAMIDGQPHRLAPGVALFILGGAIHGVPLAVGPLAWFYIFAAEGFAEIRYRFPGQAGKRDRPVLGSAKKPFRGHPGARRVASASLVALRSLLAEGRPFRPRPRLTAPLRRAPCIRSGARHLARLAAHSVT